jgi:transcriptional regulator with XRE-family HTH domain
MPRRSTKVAGPEKLIGSKIVEIRKRLGMPQVELAAKLGMSQSILSRYERGTIRLHGALVAEFARALQVSADELLGLKEAPSNGHRPLNRRFVRRLQRIESLPRRKQDALLTTIDAFLKSEGRET